MTPNVNEKLAGILVPIGDLHEDPQNVRKHSARNIDAIAASYRRFGQQRPIVALADGTVIAGNGQLAAAKKLGWDAIAVVRFTDEAQARAFAIADNRTAELADWEYEGLESQLKALGDITFLDEMAFDLERKVADAYPDTSREINDGGAEEPPENPVTRTGDMWVLGDHRILCGSSVAPADVARLMGQDRAVLLATDPPYLVDYQGGNHPQSWVNKPDVKDKHWDDYVDPDSASSFFADFLRIALAHCIERVPVYQWHTTRRQVLVEEAWKANGLLVHQTIIWVKARPVLTRCHYMWQHEPCFYGWPESKMPTKKPPPNEKTVWQINQQGENDGIHPTQKPLEIFERPINYHSDEGDVVLEPFSGSGSQIIAAERLRRKCRAMEISPAFVDAAVLRWQKATGKDAVLDGTWETFAATAAARGAPPP